MEKHPDSKTAGVPRSLTDEQEREITDRYKNETAAKLADEYRALTRNGRLTEHGIRTIVRRVRLAQDAARAASVTHEMAEGDGA